MADKVKVRINKGASAIHFEVDKSPYIVFLCNPTSTKKRVVAPFGISPRSILLWHQISVCLIIYIYITLLGQNLVSWLTKYFTYTWYGLWTCGENPLKLENVKPLYLVSDHNRRVTHSEVISAYRKYHILPSKQLPLLIGTSQGLAMILLSFHGLGTSFTLASC